MDMKAWQLDGRVAIVTGAAEGGIGEAFARTLADAGARVVCADVELDRAEEVAGKIRADGGDSIAARVDIGDETSTQALAAHANEAFGGVDILVNNAALMAQIVGTPLMQYTLEDWDRVMRVNVTGAWLMSKAVLASMRSRGAGKIINISSLGAYPAESVYGISKLAIVGLTTALAKELGPFNINVNAIAPGYTQSKAGTSLTPASGPMRDLLEARAVLRLTGTPQELANGLLLLASDAGAWISGQVLHIDGGYVTRP